MLTQSRFATMASACAVVFALVAAVILIPARADDRVRLGADILAESRGSNPSNGVYDEPCNQYQLPPIPPCSKADNPCVTCAKGALNNPAAPMLGPQSQGPGYNSGPPSNVCVNKQNGSCIPSGISYICSPNGGELGFCNTPNTPVPQ